MSSIDWGLWADWIGAVSALGTLAVAAYALGAWRVESRGSAAQEAVTAAWALRYAFYGARSPLLEAWEFPDWYWEKHHTGTLSNNENADAHWHVYQNRLKELWPYVRSVVEVRAKCGAVFGDEAAAACEKLAIEARHLRFYMEHDVSMKRAGEEAVKLWGDQELVKEVRANLLVAGSRDDKLSKDFEAAFDALLAQLNRHR